MRNGLRRTATPCKAHRTTPHIVSLQQLAPRAFEGDDESDEEDISRPPNSPGSPVRCSDWLAQYRGDLQSIALLLFLYTLQGVPMGLAASIPLILQEKNITYQQQAAFSLVFWPFSLKLLWAPLVDTIYSPRLGRRKSWLLPVQLAMGLLMLILSWFTPSLLGDNPASSTPDIWSLTLLFGLLYALAATQDIVVDGWALTMLSRKNIGMASTCNTIGQMAGYLLAYVVFLAFNSPNFCNRWLRTTPQAHGLLSLSGFLAWWGFVFIVSTVAVGLLKTEADSSVPCAEDFPSPQQAYIQMWRLCRLPSFQSLIFMLLTCKVGFAAADAITTLKLVEKGVPKETMGLLAIAIAPLNIAGTAYISHHCTGPRPLALFLQAYPVRLAMGLLYVMIVWLAPTETHTVGVGFFAVVALVTAVHQVASTFIFVTQIAFFARISDPIIGGTSMTLLNTITNLGSKWPQSLVLGLVDRSTFKVCRGPLGSAIASSCSTAADAIRCQEMGGACATVADGFTVLSVVCAALGMAWFMLFKSRWLALQELKEEEWVLPDSRRRR